MWESVAARVGIECLNLGSESVVAGCGRSLLSGDTEETAGDGRGVETAADETGTEEGVTEPPERAVFNTITRPPRSPRTSAGGTTPHEEPEPSDAGDAPEAGTSVTISAVEAGTLARASSGKCTSAVTVVRNITGATPPSPAESQATKSPTSVHAEDERRERLGSGRTSSDPEADSETRTTQAGRTDARRRTAASSTTWGTRPGTGGSAGSTPTPSTAGTDGEGAGTGSDAAEEDGEIEQQAV
ncbi:mucin-13-like [Procambarus clarkii]|uniref:mucin-13-like n=1 Tax=Procambarus clarkii TaxID=6728 RepID=UPI003744A249